MIARGCALEVKQRRLILTTVVQEVAEIDPRLRMGGIEIQRPPQPVERSVFIAQTMRCVSEAGRGLR